MQAIKTTVQRPTEIKFVQHARCELWNSLLKKVNFEIYIADRKATTFI